MGLRASFGHLFMVWAADDALVNPWNLVSRDLRRVHARMPWVWVERPYSEGGPEHMKTRSIRSIEALQVCGISKGGARFHFF